MISVIIRAKDEARWIGHCLRAVRRQQVDEPFEIILVDNGSSDATVQKAKSICPELQIVPCREPYRPGLAINLGAEASHGDRIVLLSAHCVPAHEHWMARLVGGLADERIAGAYGRQIPFGFSRASDKRDLWQLFGLDRRLQERDGFFHNANSAFSRKVWREAPFNDAVLHIEDRLWGDHVIGRGYRLAYEPDACVYHHHGVNHHDHNERCENTVRILEQLPGSYPDGRANLEAASFDIVALIAAREAVGGEEPLAPGRLAAAIDAARRSTVVRDVIVSTESARIAALAEGMGAKIPFLRPAALAHPEIRVDAVLLEVDRRLAELDRFPEVLVSLEVTYPSRPPGLIDGLVHKLIAEDLDTVMPVVAERRPCWVRNRQGVLERRDDYDVDQKARQPIYIGAPGLACAFRPDILRRYGGRIGRRVGIVELDDPDLVRGFAKASLPRGEPGDAA